MARRVNLAAFKEQKHEENSITIEAGDGLEFTVLAPECWPDEAEAFAKSGDSIGLAKVIMGDDEYALFVEAGGSAAVLGAIVADVNGLTPGE